MLLVMTKKYEELFRRELTVYVVFRIIMSHLLDMAYEAGGQNNLETLRSGKH